MKSLASQLTEHRRNTGIQEAKSNSAPDKSKSILEQLTWPIHKLVDNAKIYLSLNNLTRYNYLFSCVGTTGKVICNYKKFLEDHLDDAPGDDIRILQSYYKKLFDSATGSEIMDPRLLNGQEFETLKNILHLLLSDILVLAPYHQEAILLAAVATFKITTFFMDVFLEVFIANYRTYNYLAITVIAHQNRALDQCQMKSEMSTIVSYLRDIANDIETSICPEKATTMRQLPNKIPSKVAVAIIHVLLDQIELSVRVSDHKKTNFLLSAMRLTIESDTSSLERAESSWTSRVIRLLAQQEIKFPESSAIKLIHCLSYRDYRAFISKLILEIGSEEVEKIHKNMFFNAKTISYREELFKQCYKICPLFNSHALKIIEITSLSDAEQLVRAIQSPEEVLLNTPKSLIAAPFLLLTPNEMSLLFNKVLPTKLQNQYIKSISVLDTTREKSSFFKPNWLKFKDIDNLSVGEFKEIYSQLSISLTANIRVTEVVLTAILDLPEKDTTNDSSLENKISFGDTSVWQKYNYSYLDDSIKCGCRVLITFKLIGALKNGELLYSHLKPAIRESVELCIHVLCARSRIYGLKLGYLIDQIQKLSEINKLDDNIVNYFNSHSKIVQRLSYCQPKLNTLVDQIGTVCFPNAYKKSITDCTIDSEVIKGLKFVAQGLIDFNIPFPSELLILDVEFSQAYSEAWITHHTQSDFTIVSPKIPTITSNSLILPWQNTLFTELSKSGTLDLFSLDSTMDVVDIIYMISSNDINKNIISSLSDSSVALIKLILEPAAKQLNTIGTNNVEITKGLFQGLSYDDLYKVQQWLKKPNSSLAQLEQCWLGWRSQKNCESYCAEQTKNNSSYAEFVLLIILADMILTNHQPIINLKSFNKRIEVIPTKVVKKLESYDSPDNKVQTLSPEQAKTKVLECLPEEISDFIPISLLAEILSNFNICYNLIKLPSWTYSSSILRTLLPTHETLNIIAKTLRDLVVEKKVGLPELNIYSCTKGQKYSMEIMKHRSTISIQSSEQKYHYSWIMSRYREVLNCLIPYCKHNWCIQYSTTENNEINLTSKNSSDLVLPQNIEKAFLQLKEHKNTYNEVTLISPLFCVNLIPDSFDFPSEINDSANEILHFLSSELLSCPRTIVSIPAGVTIGGLIENTSCRWTSSILNNPYASLIALLDGNISTLVINGGFLASIKNFIDIKAILFMISSVPTHWTQDKGDSLPISHDIERKESTNLLTAIINLSKYYDILPKDFSYDNFIKKSNTSEALQVIVLFEQYPESIPFLHKFLSSRIRWIVIPDQQSITPYVKELMLLPLRMQGHQPVIYSQSKYGDKELLYLLAIQSPSLNEVCNTINTIVDSTNYSTTNMKTEDKNHDVIDLQILIAILTESLSKSDTIPKSFLTAINRLLIEINKYDYETNTGHPLIELRNLHVKNYDSIIIPNQLSSNQNILSEFILTVSDKLSILPLQVSASSQGYLESILDMLYHQLENFNMNAKSNLTMVIVRFATATLGSAVNLIPHNFEILLNSDIHNLETLSTINSSKDFFIALLNEYRLKHNLQLNEYIQQAVLVNTTDIAWQTALNNTIGYCDQSLYHNMILSLMHQGFTASMANYISTAISNDGVPEQDIITKPKIAFLHLLFLAPIFFKNNINITQLKFEEITESYMDILADEIISYFPNLPDHLYNLYLSSKNTILRTEGFMLPIVTSSNYKRICITGPVLIKAFDPENQYYNKILKYLSLLDFPLTNFSFTDSKEIHYSPINTYPYIEMPMEDDAVSIRQLLSVENFRDAANPKFSYKGMIDTTKIDFDSIEYPCNHFNWNFVVNQIRIHQSNDLNEIPDNQFFRQLIIEFVAVLYTIFSGVPGAEFILLTRFAIVVSKLSSECPSNYIWSFLSSIYNQLNLTNIKSIREQVGYRPNFPTINLASDLSDWLKEIQTTDTYILTQPKMENVRREISQTLISEFYKLWDINGFCKDIKSNDIIYNAIHDGPCPLQTLHSISIYRNKKHIDQISQLKCIHPIIFRIAVNLVSAKGSLEYLAYKNNLNKFTFPLSVAIHLQNLTEWEPEFLQNIKSSDNEFYPDMTSNQFDYPSICKKPYTFAATLAYITQERYFDHTFKHGELISKVWDQDTYMSNPVFGMQLLCCLYQYKKVDTISLTFPKKSLILESFLKYSSLIPFLPIMYNLPDILFKEESPGTKLVWAPIESCHQPISFSAAVVRTNSTPLDISRLPMNIQAIIIALINFTSHFRENKEIELLYNDEIEVDCNLKEVLMTLIQAPPACHNSGICSGQMYTAAEQVFNAFYEPTSSPFVPQVFSDFMEAVNSPVGYFDTKGRIFNSGVGSYETTKLCKKRNRSIQSETAILGSILEALNLKKFPYSSVIEDIGIYRKRLCQWVFEISLRKIAGDDITSNQFTFPYMMEPKLIMTYETLVQDYSSKANAYKSKYYAIVEKLHNDLIKETDIERTNLIKSSLNNICNKSLDSEECYADVYGLKLAIYEEINNLNDYLLTSIVMTHSNEWTAGDPLVLDFLTNMILFTRDPLFISDKEDYDIGEGGLEQLCSILGFESFRKNESDWTEVYTETCGQSWKALILKTRSSERSQLLEKLFDISLGKCNKSGLRAMYILTWVFRNTSADTFPEIQKFKDILYRETINLDSTRREATNEIFKAMPHGFL